MKQRNEPKTLMKRDNKLEDSLVKPIPKDYSIFSTSDNESDLDFLNSLFGEVEELEPQKKKSLEIEEEIEEESEEDIEDQEEVPEQSEEDYLNYNDILNLQEDSLPEIELALEKNSDIEPSDMSPDILLSMDDSNNLDILDLINEINNTQELPLDEEQEGGIESKATNQPKAEYNAEFDINSVYEDALSAVTLEDIEFDDELLSIIPDLDSRTNSKSQQAVKSDKKSNKKSSKNEKLSKTKKEKQGFWGRFFGNVKEELTEEEIEARKQKLVNESVQKEQQKKKQEEDIKAKKERSKIEKAEKDKKAKELAAKKKLDKTAKEQAKKEAKEKRAREIQELVDDLDVNEGKINKVGASIVFVFFAATAIVIVIGTNLYSYAVNIKTASESFNRRLYDQAYENVYGIEIREEDIEVYDKIMTVMFVNKQLNSYENYMNMKKFPEALDSLLKGLDRYEKYYMLATMHGIEDDLNYVKEHIVEELNQSFYMSEDQASVLLAYENQEEYSQAVYKLANEHAEELLEEVTKEEAETETSTESEAQTGAESGAETKTETKAN